ncbi:MAG: ATP-binding protein, partial [Lachnospiraceae bacterium]|nr:ATP-binding protein [Lachnospiraceae bacterium]
LPREQRVILVKAGEIQKFFVILIENNCEEENKDIKKRTAKQDDFLHGFGISNMRKAAGKYGGWVTTKCENGKFTLKILIPVP